MNINASIFSLASRSHVVAAWAKQVCGDVCLDMGCWCVRNGSVLVHLNFRNWSNKISYFVLDVFPVCWLVRSHYFTCGSGTYFYASYMILVTLFLL